MSFRMKNNNNQCFREEIGVYTLWREERDKRQGETNRQPKEEQNCAPQIYFYRRSVFSLCCVVFQPSAKRMSDDGNEDPGLSDNEDGPSLSVHDEEDDELFTLGIYCDAEFRLQDLKEALKQYAHARNFQANPHSTLASNIHSSHCFFHPLHALPIPNLSPLLTA